VLHLGDERLHRLVLAGLRELLVTEHDQELAVALAVDLVGGQLGEVAEAELVENLTQQGRQARGRCRCRRWDKVRHS